jgi:hypothetical protein
VRRNEILRSALAGLIGKPFAKVSVAFILELNGLPRQMVLERLRHADVIYAEGGNHYHLANSIIVTGLAAEMSSLVESQVYVGVSAGSMIFSRYLSDRTGKAFGEHEDLRILGETPASSLTAGTYPA